MKKDLTNFLYPKSIAIIGASSKKGTLSWELVNNLINFGYTGKLFPVNPKADSVHSIKAHSYVYGIKDKIDMAIIMLPRNLVLPAIDDCNKKKIKSIVVITAGFKEVGSEGAEVEKALVQKIKKYKMTLIGPNCMGIINTHPDIRMNGTFVLGTPIHGGIGFVSQSGALGAAVLKTVQLNDVGFGQFLSIGNKADVSGNTVLEFWKDNPHIKVITVYLESFGNARKFMELTREITKKKPVIVIKSARTAAGVKAASSHTGALATSDTVVDAFLEQGGVIRVNTTDEMFDIAKAFDNANLPKGNRVGILTNAGGPAILAVDECENERLLIPELEKITQEKLRKIAPPEGSVFNPVDMLPPATAEMYYNATKVMLEDPNIDSLIVILGPPLMLDTLEIGKSICNAAKTSDKTCMIVLMSQDDIISRLRVVMPEHPPTFRFPEPAARAIGQMLRYKKWQETPQGKIINYSVNKTIVRKLLTGHRTGTQYIRFDKAKEILKAYGFPLIETYLVKNDEEMLLTAKNIGYPVVLKTMGKELIHKSDIGGVAVDIHTEAELLSIANRMKEKLNSHNLLKHLEGFIVQPFLLGGVETIMGVSKDEKAGHLIMFGLGGIYVEVFKDVKFRLVPITDVEAESLIKSVKCYKLLAGTRGKEKVDIEIIKENLLRLSQLVTDFPQFEEIDFNPFVFSPEKSKCRILDARMKVSIK
jgi:acetyltransferase